MIYAFLFGFGPHSVVLRAYSWLSAQESLLAVLWGAYGMLIIEPELLCVRQVPCPLHQPYVTAIL